MIKIKQEQENYHFLNQKSVSAKSNNEEILPNLMIPIPNLMIPGKEEIISDNNNNYSPQLKLFQVKYRYLLVRVTCKITR